MVDHGLATPAAVPWSGADARHRRDNDSRRRAWVGISKDQVVTMGREVTGKLLMG